jgi:hypothetical protein
MKMKIAPVVGMMALDAAYGPPAETSQDGNANQSKDLEQGMLQSEI